MQTIRKKNVNKLIFAHLNINSIRNKFDSVVKIDGSFPKGQFQIKGFSDPFRVDRNCHGGGILLHAREDIPVKLLSV